MSRHPLLPQIGLALIVKLTIILAAALFVFSPRQRPKIDATAMEEHLMGGSPAAPQSRSASP